MGGGGGDLNQPGERWLLAAGGDNGDNGRGVGVREQVWPGGGDEFRGSECK